MYIENKFSVLFRLCGATRVARQDQKAPDRFYVATASRIGEAIPTEQVPQQTEEV